MTTKRAIRRFTASKADSLPVGEYTDPACVGLQLRVRPKGNAVTRTWLFRYKWHGTPTRITLGHLPGLSLSEARERALEARKQLDDGIDPRRARPRRTRPASPQNAAAAVVDPGAKFSIETLAHDFLERHVKPSRKRPEYAARILNVEVLPEWKGRDVRTIQPYEVIELLDGIVDRGSKVMANRVAGLLGQMFKFGIHRRFVPVSPVQLLYRPGGKEKSRERALSDDELKAFLKHKDDILRSPRTGHALMVLLLTMQRRSELALAEWWQIDFEERTWTIPDELAKAGKGHIVPLTDWAIAELKAMKKLAGRSRYVYPTEDGKASAEGKLITRSVARCQDAFQAVGMKHWTPHDLRRTGRTGLARLKIEPHIAERVLNHAQERIPGTYDVHDYIVEKRAALEKWEARLRELKQ